MKLFALIFSIIVLAGSSLNAQRPDRAELKRLKLDYIKERLQLTQAEEVVFLPIYQEYEKKRDAIYTARRTMMHKYRDNSLNITDAQLIAMSDKFIQQDQDLANLSVAYHTKFKAVLPPIKVMLLYKAEQEFKKELINNMRHHRNRSGKGN